MSHPNQPASVLSVRAGEIEIAYRSEGSGEPVLFINGTGESSATWQRIVRALSGRRCCVAIDNRDTGHSSYVEAAYAPADLARDAAAVIESLGLAPAHVVGYSLGGAAAQELAIARPELVRSLVLLSTWARSDGWFVAQMRNWQSIRRAHWEDEDGFLRALAPWMYAPETFAKDAVGSIEGWIAGIETPQRPEGWLRQCDADIAHDAAARLGSVRAPALVIVGEDDICTPPRYSRELCSMLPDAELLTIPSAAHAAVFERPDEVARAIESFLDRR